MHPRPRPSFARIVTDVRGWSSYGDTLLTVRYLILVAFCARNERPELCRGRELLIADWKSTKNCFLLGRKQVFGFRLVVEVCKTYSRELGWRIAPPKNGPQRSIGCFECQRAFPRGTVQGCAQEEPGSSVVWPVSTEKVGLPAW